MVTRAEETSHTSVSQSDSMQNEEYTSLYQKEWESLFSSKYYLKQLKSSAMKGTLKSSHFRSICWKVFLECLPENRHLWIDTAKSQRQRYVEILDKFDTNPRSLDTLDINVNNPLSQVQQSPWNQYFEDSELKVTIEQDVVRTFPEIDFFHTEKIQKMMISILFSYAREFPQISYKQGMHELLAPIIFVLHYDQQAYLQASELDSLDLEIHILLNQNYIEHDAFFLFCQLMEGVETWYTMSDFPFSKYVKLITEEPFSQSPAVPGNSLGRKLKRIYERLLKHHDTELFLYFEQMEITPQIFGIRWLRLLFGREFSIHDLLIVWDAIFADNIAFNLVDFIFVAMLISIRELLLQGDYASCLSHLMRFPNVMDVHYIIDLALHLRDPNGFKLPEGSTVKVINPLQLKTLKDGRQTVYKGVSKNSVGPSKSTKAQILSNKQPEKRPKSLSIAGVNKLWNSNAESSSLATRTKSSSLSERNTNVSSDPNSDSSSEFLNEAISSTVNSGTSFTLPRTSIRNVMESKNHKFRAADLSQTPEHCNNKSSSSETRCREMVPLIPSSSVSPTSSNTLPKKDYHRTLKDAAEEIRLLKVEISDLRLMNVYCTQQISRHLEKLQESMMQQSLLYEDEMFIALAGLKRARDILKGTVSFTEEVIDDDIGSYCAISKTNPMYSGDVSTNEQSKLQILQSGHDITCSKNGSDAIFLADLSEKNKQSSKSLNCKFSNSLSELQTVSSQEQKDDISCSLQRKLSMEPL